MPLVDVFLKPGFRLMLLDMNNKGNFFKTESETNLIVKRDFAPALPMILVKYAKLIGLDANTPPEGVQVMCHNYGEYDINIANVWVKVQFSERMPSEDIRKIIRDKLYEEFINWFIDAGFIPQDFVMDLFWGPTNGKGVVDGVKIEW